MPCLHRRCSRRQRRSLRVSRLTLTANTASQLRYTNLCEPSQSTCRRHTQTTKTICSRSLRELVTLNKRGTSTSESPASHLAPSVLYAIYRCVYSVTSYEACRCSTVMEVVVQLPYPPSPRTTSSSPSTTLFLNSPLCKITHDSDHTCPG